MSFDPTHAVFKDHFPDNPIVPAVLLLEAVKEAICEAYPNDSTTAIPTVKFTKLIRPTSSCKITLEKNFNQIKFMIISDNVISVKGSFVVCKNSAH